MMYPKKTVDTFFLRTAHTHTKTVNNFFKKMCRQLLFKLVTKNSKALTKNWKVLTKNWKVLKKNIFFAATAHHKTPFKLLSMEFNPREKSMKKSEK